MTDWLARAAAKLADKSKPAEVQGESKECVQCGRPIGHTSGWWKNGTVGPYCGPCDNAEDLRITNILKGANDEKGIAAGSRGRPRRGNRRRNRTHGRHSHSDRD